MRQEEESDALELDGVIGSYELSNRGAGNQTWVSARAI